MKEAIIICHSKLILPGRYDITYEWKGNRQAVVKFNRSFMASLTKEPITGGWPQRLDLFPWPLRLVRVEPAFFEEVAIYARTDSAAWVWLWLLHKTGRVWWWVYARLIFTAMVWGLAYVEPGERPSWRCLGKQQP